MFADVDLDLEAVEGVVVAVFEVEECRDRVPVCGDVRNIHGVAEAGCGETVEYFPVGVLEVLKQ